METKGLYEKLCICDKRHPYHDTEYADEIPRQGCACDNCFYGRDKLALEIIRLQEMLKEYQSVQANSERPQLNTDDYRNSPSGGPLADTWKISHIDSYMICVMR